MLSNLNLQTIHLPKNEIADLIRYSDFDAPTIKKMKKAEAVPAKIKGKKDYELEKKISKVLSGSKVKIPPIENGCWSNFKSCLSCWGFFSREQDTAEEVVPGVSQEELTCRTRREFIDLMNSTTADIRLMSNHLTIIREFMEVHDDPSAEVQGLSRIGGAMWLLTFAVQHLIDPEKAFPELTDEMIKIRAVYSDIGNYSQHLVHMMDALFIKVSEVRQGCLAIVKHLRKTYSLDYNPCDLRPAVFVVKSRFRRRHGPVIPDPETRTAEELKEADEVEEDTFQVQWTPLNIVFRHSDHDFYENYAMMSIKNRAAIFKTFCTSERETLETAIEEISNVASPITNLVTGIPPPTPDANGVTPTRVRTQTGPPGSLVEKIMSMKKYLRLRAPQESYPNLQELDGWRVPLEEFWVTADILYDATYELVLTAAETRDAVRSCYLYATNFYHWKMPNFDDFDALAQTKAARKDKQKANTFVAKLLGYRRYSDAALFLSLADFTSSIYQDIAKRHEVRADGMSLKLDSWADEQSETWGLVGERDEFSVFKPSQVATGNSPSAGPSKTGKIKFANSSTRTLPLK